MTEYSSLEKIRLEKIQQLKDLGIDPFPLRAKRTHTSRQAIKALEDLEAAGSSDKDLDPLSATLAGRIRATRAMGKLTFAHIEDGDGKIQLFLRVNEVGQERVTFFNEMLDIGDFIQASGTLMRTRTGEATLLVEDYMILSKAVSPLPAAKDEELEDGTIIRHAALEDSELRARQRYADLAVNPDTRKVFQMRSKTIKALRNFLDEKGFLEVETPILQPIYGGAAAKPFTTYHNQLKQNLYLRISFELYLKRLLVGNLEKVYEIGRDFRNEGVSFKHNPEFTQLEFYWAYADYLMVMDLTEEMISSAVTSVLGTTKVSYQGEELNFKPPWRRLQIRQGIKDATGIDIHEHDTAESLRIAMGKLDKSPDPQSTRGKLIDQMINDYLEPTLIQPTFLYDYPRDISPLAKSKTDDPLTVERFETYMAGFELCNAFTELNDPLDQESRFIEMSKDYKKDDEEKHPMDEDYLRAMRYGMPPNGGFGMGIDRFVMILMDKHNIRDVLLFPHLRKEDSG
ncbi:lysine--tRNA ligase [Chloroflexota bacterium]